MNTLKIEAELAKEYGYKPLPEDIRCKYRNLFKENIPKFLTDITNTDITALYSIDGTQICNGYNRIVIGDYGAFVELLDNQMILDNIIVKMGQEYRINDERYSKNCKYEWYTLTDNSDIKLYKQKRTVKYADYKPKMWYVSVHQVFLSKNEGI